LDQPGKVLKRAIEGGLGLFRKTATWQLPRLEMVGDAFATDPLLSARIVGAITFGQVLLLVTFHKLLSFHARFVRSAHYFALNKILT